MLIERIEVRLVELPLVEPFRAAHGTMTSRELAIVRIDTNDGVGWGECSALPEPTYSDDFAAGAFVILDEELAPRLVGHQLSAGSVATRLASVVGNPMAKAALEMALLDAELRRDGLSLASRLGVTADEVPAGAVVGLGPIDEVTERVATLAAEGFGRVKLKIAPGHDLDVVSAVRTTSPTVEVQVDANGAYDGRYLDLLTELVDMGVSAIEQPFAVGDDGSAAELVARGVLVIADEAATSTAAVERLHHRGALSGVSIKPARLGGIGAAVQLHDWSVDHGMTATAGGMIECGLGRHALAAVAALPGFVVTGDLSPARRWISVDPWPDLVMGKGSSPGTIAVPSAPGVAPHPDPELLSDLTSRLAIVKA